MCQPAWHGWWGGRVRSDLPHLMSHWTQEVTRSLCSCPSRAQLSRSACFRAALFQSTNLMISCHLCSDQGLGRLWSDARYLWGRWSSDLLRDASHLYPASSQSQANYSFFTPFRTRCKLSRMYSWLHLSFQVCLAIIFSRNVSPWPVNFLSVVDSHLLKLWS